MQRYTAHQELMGRQINVHVLESICNTLAELNNSHQAVANYVS